MNRLPSPPYSAAGKLPNGHERCTVGAIRWIQPAACTSGVRPSPRLLSFPCRSLSPAERSLIAVPRCGGFGSRSSSSSSPPHPHRCFALAYPSSTSSLSPPSPLLCRPHSIVASLSSSPPSPTVASHSVRSRSRPPHTYPSPLTSRPRLSTSSTAPPPLTLAS